MHPVIRILCSVIFIALIAAASWWYTALPLFILAGMHVSLGRGAVSALLVMTRRIRWLLISILVISFWFTPGEALLPFYPHWSPTKEGILFGIHRVVILVEIVMTVNLLLFTTSPEKLVPAIQWLLSPLRYFRIGTDRLAIRLVLTLHAVKQPLVNMRQLVEDSVQQGIIARTSHVVAEAYSASISMENATGNEWITLEEMQRPALAQWLWLPLLAGMYYLPGMVN